LDFVPFLAVFVVIVFFWSVERVDTTKYRRDFPNGKSQVGGSGVGGLTS